jgi:hypothetical protein
MGVLTCLKNGVDLSSPHFRGVSYIFPGAISGICGRVYFTFCTAGCRLLLLFVLIRWVAFAFVHPLFPLSCTGTSGSDGQLVFLTGGRSVFALCFSGRSPFSLLTGLCSSGSVCIFALSVMFLL